MPIIGAAPDVVAFAQSMWMYKATSIGDEIVTAPRSGRQLRIPTLRCSERPRQVTSSRSAMSATGRHRLLSVPICDGAAIRVSRMTAHPIAIVGGLP
jgi:hypothetical protein